MLNRLVVFTAAALIAGGSGAARSAPAANADAAAVVPRIEIIEDRTIEMWSARWWAWLASFPASESPAADREGTRCGEGQEGAVFFLAGSYGARPVERSCPVPAGKYLFFPLVTYIMMPDDGNADCDVLRERAAGLVARASLFAELDGKPIADLEGRRAAPAKCFNVNARSPAGPKVMSASDGYWLMLRPLAKGRHTLHFGGLVPSLAQDIRYTLLVE